MDRLDGLFSARSFFASFLFNGISCIFGLSLLFVGCLLLPLFSHLNENPREKGEEKNDKFVEAEANWNA